MATTDRILVLGSGFTKHRLEQPCIHPGSRDSIQVKQQDTSFRNPCAVVANQEEQYNDSL